MPEPLLVENPVCTGHSHKLQPWQCARHLICHVLQLNWWCLPLVHSLYLPPHSQIQRRKRWLSPSLFSVLDSGPTILTLSQVRRCLRLISFPSLTPHVYSWSYGWWLCTFSTCISSSAPHHLLPKLFQPVQKSSLSFAFLIHSSPSV